MPSTAVLELPAAPPNRAHAGLHVQRHRPRRQQTATSVLRAIGTGPIPQIVAPAGQETRGSAARPEGVTTATPSGGDQSAAAAVRSLRMRDIAAGGAAATGSWTIASHLGLLGTATGTFIASVASTVLVAIAADSLAGTRVMLLRTLRRWRQVHRHRPRR